MKNNHSWQLSSRVVPNKQKGDTLPPFSPWDWEGFEPLPSKKTPAKGARSVQQSNSC